MNSIPPSSNPSNIVETLESLKVQGSRAVNKKRVFMCDRCGCEMREMNCKIACLNCGNRFDCSDLNIYLD